MKIYTLTTRSFLIAIPFMLLAFCSCRKDMPELERPNDYVGGNFEEIFEAYWNGMNNNYVFWDVDTTDWDQVYRRYKPLFANLNLNDTADVRTGYTYFKTMTNGLVDGHYSIQFRSPILRDSASINPSFQRMQRMEDFRNQINPNHFFNTIPAIYLNSGASRALVNAPGRQTFAVSGSMEEGIFYLYFNTFNLRNTYNNSEAFAATLDHFFTNVLEGEQPRGIIIDVRNNFGGALADLDFLLGRMITSPLHFAYTKSKLDNNRLDYTPWIPARVNPVADAKQITAPIVVLADRYSVSMAEITAMAVKAMPNGHFIGERTWGAMGPLTGNFVYNGGQYSTSFMDLVYTSSLQLKGLDNQSYEGIGYPPDQVVPVNLAALAMGRDAQLEAAVQLINRQ
ncbi:S41 family peptidase [Sphingobacterium sp. lm-10]|uniref:S41 family peptidase n=1 Tax=Sphingobacterium sp. lm-10 TaxID=2944904 RepID=UPI0020203614|nr:S41 family peptidase [Sphingobacterium sp. lm-10]MCL7986488.1 S41 family peptidase [Sphingobacterium sp. lm-10]